MSIEYELSAGIPAITAFETEVYDATDAETQTLTFDVEAKVRKIIRCRVTHTCTVSAAVESIYPI